MSKHQRVPHYIGVMNRYFDRQKQARHCVEVGGLEGYVSRLTCCYLCLCQSLTFHCSPESDTLLLAEDALLLDPVGNSPLKIFRARRDELSLMPKATHIKLPLRLTACENSVNAQQGTVLLLGRSGTGKTVCLCNRMTSDRRQLQAAIVRGSDRNVQQLFVCRRCAAICLSLFYLSVYRITRLLHLLLAVLTTCTVAVCGTAWRATTGSSAARTRMEAGRRASRWPRATS